MIVAFVSALFAACSFVGSAGAADDAVTLTGYVVDANCGVAMAKKLTGHERAARHTKACALEEQCAASGYGIFSEGKWVKFDTNGDRLAKRGIEKSTRERGHYFAVTGRMEGGIFLVTALKEVPPQKKAG